MSAIACFTFDNMGEAAEVGAGTLDGPRPAGEDPSLARGYPEILRVLEAHGVAATFFVEGWNGEHHPEAVADLARRGHELGMHGWAHEAWGDLDAATEERLARRATDALERAAGVRPRGFRAPGGQRTERTGALLAGLGYDYDASLGDGMRPGRLADGLAQIPFVWPAVDGFHYLRPTPSAAEEVRDLWLAALDRAASRGGLFLLVCHAFITGTDDRRMAALDAVIAAARRDPRVEIRTAGEVAASLVP